MVTIGCSDPSMKLKITGVFYGYVRPGLTQCPGYNQKKKTCNSKFALSATKSICQNLNICTFQAANGIIGPDPCGGTYKYYTVNYDCSNKNSLLSYLKLRVIILIMYNFIQFIRPLSPLRPLRPAQTM